MMNAAAQQHEWTKFLQFFGEQNAGRLTRLGVFEKNRDVVTDYWLESGLPFGGANLDVSSGRLILYLTVGGFTHEVIDPLKLQFQFTREGEEDGIDVQAADGRTTVLRFEPDPRGA
jgi:hypothetical protein